MEEKIVLTKSTFKALASESRIEILKVLNAQKHTLTDLSENLGLSMSTVKEHLDVLLEAGLIKHIEDGRKWKYYKLTFKGKRFIEPTEVKVFFTFVLTLVMLPVSTYLFYKKFFSVKLVPLMAKSGAISREATFDMVTTPATNIVIKNPFPTLEFILLVLFLLILLFCVGYFVYKRRKRK